MFNHRSESVQFDDSTVQPVVIELPPCELSKLDSIFELVTSAIPSAVQRESLALAMEKENYIAKLLELFHMCEQSRLQPPPLPQKVA